MKSKVFALLLAVFVLSSVRAFALKTPSLIFPSKHFRVYYVPGDDVRAEYVADRSEEWYSRLRSRLGEPEDWTPVPIKVYTTHDAFIGSTGDQFGERLVGRAYSGNSLIELDASEMYSPMTTIIAHELTHIFIFRILGPNAANLPLWANEGIAKTEAGEWDELDAQAIADAAAAGRIPRLSDLTDAFPKGDNTLAYAESAAVIRYISSHSDRPFVRPLLLAMRDGLNFSGAVFKVTGKGVDQWEKEWRREVNRQYVPYGWLRTVGFIAGLALPILAVAAYLVMRRKKQNYIEQYGSQEGYSPDVDKEYWPED